MKVIKAPSLSCIRRIKTYVDSSHVNHLAHSLKLLSSIRHMLALVSRSHGIRQRKWTFDCRITFRKRCSRLLVWISSCKECSLLAGVSRSIDGQARFVLEEYLSLSLSPNGEEALSSSSHLRLNVLIEKRRWEISALLFLSTSLFVLSLLFRHYRWKIQRRKECLSASVRSCQIISDDRQSGMYEEEEKKGKTDRWIDLYKYQWAQ
jgi:hypothetical protein